MDIIHTKNPKDVIDNIRQTSEAMLQSTEKAIESTSEFANDVKQGHIDPVVDMMTAAAKKLAKQGKSVASDATDYAQQAMNRATEASTQYVAEQPIKAVLVAAAVGAAVAIAITSMRSRGNASRF